MTANMDAFHALLEEMRPAFLSELPERQLVRVCDLVGGQGPSDPSRRSFMPGLFQ